MIAGVDHLALSCNDLDDAGARLRAAGYREAFVERGVTNAAVKGPFLNELRATHSLAYYEANGGTPVELTHHGGPVARRRAHYAALVAAPPGEPADDDAWSSVWEAAGYGHAAAYVWTGLDTTVWATEGEGVQAVRAVLSPASDIGRAVAFWSKGVGCRLAARGSAAGRRWARLTLDAMLVGRRLELVVAEGQPHADTHLDDSGFPCLGLLCTDLELDGEQLLVGGAVETSGRFDVNVNGKPLAIAFFRGPDGELLELIEPRRHTG